MQDGQLSIIEKKDMANVPLVINRPVDLDF